MDGSGGVPREGLRRSRTTSCRPSRAGTCPPQSAAMFSGWVSIFLDFVGRSGTTRAEGPHGGASCVRGAKRNRIDPRRGGIEHANARRVPNADEANEIELTPMGVELSGSRRVPNADEVVAAHDGPEASLDGALERRVIQLELCALVDVLRDEVAVRLGVVVDPVFGLITKQGGNIFRVGIFLDSVWRSGTTRTEGPHGGVTHRTCGGPDGIGLTPMGVELNGSGRVRWPRLPWTGSLKKSGQMIREHANGQLDFVRLPARVEGSHVGPQHVWCLTA